MPHMHGSLSPSVGVRLMLRIDLPARRWGCPTFYAHIDMPVLMCMPLRSHGTLMRTNVRDSAFHGERCTPPINMVNERGILETQGQHRVHISARNGSICTDCQGLSASVSVSRVLCINGM